MKERMQKTLSQVNGCPQRDRSETEWYGGVQTFMWMCEDNIVEVPFDKEHLLEQILSPANLNRAYKAVMRNKGCGGIDKMSCEQLLPWLLTNKDELMSSLLDGSYRPNPVKRVEIPKDNGKMRLLGIPTVRPLQNSYPKICSLHYFLYLYGMKQTLSSPSFADVVLGQRKVKQTFFSQIDKLIDWTPIRGIIEIAYTKGYKSTGRPSYDSLILFKIELLRTWYGLSDGEVEEQVNDRLSFSRFVGLGLEDTAPDSTTVCRFRNTLVEAELYDMVLNEINRQLESKGVIVKRGAIIDASITDTPRRPRGRKEYEVVEDRNEADSRDSSEKAMVKEVIKPNVDGDARWIKKMGKLHFGYKRHTVTDENGLILAEETTAANESDIKHLETPLQKANLPVRTPVYADKGYNSSENKEVLTRMKLKSRIMHKGVRGKKITEREQRINVSISKIRYRVERTFGSMHRWFRAGVARYVGLAKTHAQHIMEAVAYNLYRTPGIIVSNSLK